MSALKKNSISPKKVSSSVKEAANKKKLKKNEARKTAKVVKTTKVARRSETEEKKTKASTSKKDAKKSKKVIIDVIEDDLDYSPKDKKSLADFLNASLPVYDNGVIKDELIEDLDIESDDEDFDFPEEIDNQKKFFDELKAEVLEKKERKASLENEDEDVKDILELFSDDDDKRDSEIKKMKNSRPLFLYTKFVWKFLVIVGLLVFFVLYLFFSKLDINIVPSTEAVNPTISLRVSENSSGVKLVNDEREDVKGLVKKVKVSAEDSFAASGEEFVGEALSARVKIVNNHGQTQTLVKTTRLMSPDNKLFRIKDSVTVPAGSSVWVDVYPDKVSREYAINPTTFIIPGLWVGLQDKIYAKSEEPFVFEQKREKYVRASDIAQAEKEINDKLLSDIVSSIEKEKTILEKTEGQKYLYVYDNEGAINLKVDAKAEDKKDSFSAQAETEIVVAFFPKDEVVELGHNYLKILTPSNKELFEFNPDNAIYSFDSYDEEKQEVLVKATFVGKMMVKSTENIINREELLGLKSDQIAAYLQNNNEIDSFELKFSPAFLKSAPKLIDRIEVNIINK